MATLQTLNVNTDGTTGSGRGEMPDVVGLIAWLVGDKLIRGIDELVDAEYDESVALTAEEKTKRAAALRAKELEVERVEEAIIEVAAEEGSEIWRRVAADHRAGP